MASRFKLPESDLHSLMLRLEELERLNSRLLEDLKRLEFEKKLAESMKERYEREYYRLRAELERHRRPPHLVGYVVGFHGNQVLIRSSTGPKFLVQKPLDLKLEPGDQIALNQQSMAIVDVLPQAKDPMVYGFEVLEKPGVSYHDIGGLKQQLQEIKECIEYPLLYPERFSKIGIDPPKGVLFYGPSGTGKTLVAKAVATHTNATFIRVVGSEFVQKYIGEGARLVREVFQLAKEKAPSIVFIDELDAIGSRRLNESTSGDREVYRTLLQLLSIMDGFSPLENVRIIGATNRPDLLDPALLRPGRFDRLIEFPLPDAQARLEILRIHTKKMPLRDVDLESIAEQAEGASGADLRAIAMEAGMQAVREARDYVGPRDFQVALAKVLKREPQQLVKLDYIG